MFDLVDETLNQMAFFVEMPIVFPALLAIPARRDDGLCFFVNDHLDEIVSIVRAISNYAIKVVIGDQCICLRDVVSLTAGQKKPHWIAQSIDTHVDLGAESPSAAPKGLFCLPTAFFDAPAAQGCALTTVLSRIRFSMSGSCAKC